MIQNRHENYEFIQFENRIHICYPKTIYLTYRSVTCNSAFLLLLLLADPHVHLRCWISYSLERVSV